MMKRQLQENIKRVEGRIAAACARADRPRSSVNVITVTKYATLEAIRSLVELGVVDFGENRVQELTKRAAMIRELESRRSLDGSGTVAQAPRWHMIGHLQRNKVRSILPSIEMIHSVDSLRLAEEIDLEAARIGRRVPILLQVNSSGETSKTGVAVAAATHLVEQVLTLENLDLRGLMTMGPLTDDQTAIRNAFHRTRELFDEICAEELAGPEFCEISMGMSQDFELAIEIGATYVRIGSALFEGIELAPEPASVE